MKYRATAVAGAFVVSLDPRGDDRGFFARLFCADEFRAQGLENVVSQINTSGSVKAGTLRGMHYQVAPHGEAKLVRCIRGSAFDSVIDLRPGSTTFGRYAAETLTADNRLMMYVPKGCGHGFMTLDDDTEMLYLASTPYHAASERIVRWNDPRFAVEWPRAPAVMTDKDRNAADYDVASHGPGY